MANADRFDANHSAGAISAKGDEGEVTGDAEPYALLANPAAAAVGWYSGDMTPLPRISDLADWSEPTPLVEAANLAPTLPGVYILYCGDPSVATYVGMAGERKGAGLRGRLRVYVSGKGAVSGFGEAAFDRALQDEVWVAERLAEAKAGTPKRAKEVAALAVTRLDPKVCWAVTADKAEAQALEDSVLAVLPDLWNRRLASGAREPTALKRARRVGQRSALTTTTEPRVWLIRTGERGYALPGCVEAGVVALQYTFVGDASSLTVDEIALGVERAATKRNPRRVAQMLYEFVHSVQIGDVVLTPYQDGRAVHFGQVTGEYRFCDPSPVPDLRHVRDVEWWGSFSRATDIDAHRLVDIDRPPTLYPLSDQAHWLDEVMRAKPNRRRAI